MSDQRLVWTGAEKTLLIHTRLELPRATVQELTHVFNNRSNHLKRTSIAVRTKLRILGLSSKPRSSIRFPTMPATLGGLSLPNRSKANLTVSTKPVNLRKELQRTYHRPLARYDSAVLELGIFLPLHPLLAEARQYASKPPTPRHCKDLRVTLPWPPTLGNDTISKLRCEAKDKLVLQKYMDYLRGLTSKPKALGFSSDEGSASQSIQNEEF